MPLNWVLNCARGRVELLLEIGFSLSLSRFIPPAVAVIVIECCRARVEEEERVSAAGDQHEHQQAGDERR